MKAPAASRKAGEQGYALIAAVACIALFAAIALAIATATRIEITSGAAEIARARATAAADAGIAIGLHGLISRDSDTLAQLDGRSRTIDLAGARITLRIEDERGKIPLNHIDEPAVTRMLRLVGLEDARLAIARDSLLRWIGAGGAPTADGYAPAGIKPRGGALLSIDELARIRGFSPDIVARLRPIVTVQPDAIPFDPTHAQPLAIAAMSESGADTPEVIERQRESAGDRVVLAFDDGKALVGRPFTVAVDAEAPGNGHAHREAVVVVTGSSAHPYVIRRYW